jgi:hypothetical protein
MIAIAAAAPEALASYVAGALAGPLVREALRHGRRPWRAVLWGVAPAVVWTVGVALSGFQPIPEEFAASLDALFEDAASQGDLPAESVAELRESSKTAVEVLRRTWVASEAIWIWASLALGYGWVRRTVGPGWPGFGPFARLDLPDGIVWAFIVGLSALLLRRQGALEIVGANLVLATGFAFTLRGFAIESFWMDRALFSSSRCSCWWRRGWVCSTPGSTSAAYGNRSRAATRSPS